MGQRKAELSRRTNRFDQLSNIRSLHADGLERHICGRLRGRAPRCWWSSLQHSGVPLQPAGQRHWASTVLEEEEPQAPGYVVHKIAVWRPTVSMTISGVCRYSPGGNWVGQLPYQESFVPVTVSTYPTITMCANTTEDREKEAEDTCLYRNMTSLFHIWMDGSDAYAVLLKLSPRKCVSIEVQRIND
jgi:hypothetical protein